MRNSLLSSIRLRTPCPGVLRSPAEPALSISISESDGRENIRVVIGRGTTSPVSSSHSRCDRCHFVRRACLCADIPTIDTRTRIVIVRHSQERNRSSNSGRLAHLALSNSLIVEHGSYDRSPAQLPDLDGAWLLFPVGSVTPEAPVLPPSTLIVLDATWSQARRMYRKLPVHKLPALHLAGDAMAARRLRRSPGPGQLSTIESIAQALRMLEGDRVAAPLEQLFDTAVSRAYDSGRNRA